MIRAIIFDFNGILVDDEHLHFELFRELLAERGVELAEAEYFAEYVGYDDKTAFSTALQRAGMIDVASLVQAFIDEKADRLYVADVAGDAREEIVVLSGSSLRVYAAEGDGANPDAPSPWTQPAYRRSKTTWNYYSP